MKNITIPITLQMVVDDVGWHNGADDRLRNRPSRSGLPRMHQPEDYLALNEIGKGLNMKIICSMVLGEWDKDNILRGVPHVTYDEVGWDRASEIDMDYAKRCFEALENSEYLDYSLHGLMHGYYESGKLVRESQYYPDGIHPLPLEEFEKQIQLFLEIYHSWGFQKEIKTFVSPCGARGTYEENRGYANILKKYGMTIWANGWTAEKEIAEVKDGMIFIKEIPANMPWNAYDVDPVYLTSLVKEGEQPRGAGFGGHLTNFIRFNPEKNMELVPAWIEYFKRQAEVFGVMLSRDISFAASQTVYHRYAKIYEEDNKCIIDFGNVDNVGALGLSNEVYVSIKNGRIPKNCTGGAISEYEVHEDFKNYKLVRDGSTLVEISFM